MCGRFSLARPIDEVAELFGSEPLSDLTPFQPSWNVAPQAFVPIITETGLHDESDVPRHMRLMRWGFRPSWAKPSQREPINARVETVASKPMFRTSYQRRRGVLPADGWYEWMTTPQGKVPWYHHRFDDRMCLFAVVWDRWQQDGAFMESCAMLTREANEDCNEVHDRMPVLLTADEVSPWLSKALLPRAPVHGTIDRHPVSREVNRATVDHAGLTQPLPSLFDQEYGA